MYWINHWWLWVFIHIIPSVCLNVFLHRSVLYAFGSFVALKWRFVLWMFLLFYGSRCMKWKWEDWKKVNLRWFGLGETHLQAKWIFKWRILCSYLGRNYCFSSLSNVAVNLLVISGLSQADNDLCLESSFCRHSSWTMHIFEVPESLTSSKIINKILAWRNYLSLELLDDVSRAISSNQIQF